ncbi:ubiquitin-associated domain-containing protein 1 isoform X2 [Rhipicephalus sanguineus]|uniref:ubiquitin-associated domain-containing protein 1 isoform X2 n=1 Tax=Rhipicephalus sanguineus TaxID=34632 RepID=UPI001895BAF9|nr:ubiquitin-associated domain-containing protein 1 isoform X2 [Rhipicephalus sanguineus]
MLYLSTRLSGACEMKISVMSSTGVEWTVEILPEYTVEKLKQMSLSHFCNPLDCIKLSDYYKLVSVSQARPLCDQSSVREEKIRDGDELLLLKRSSTFSVNANKSCEFHTELRRILVSLVELSEKLLRHHPDIENIFKNLQSKLMEKSEPEIDEAALKKLLEMGFEEQQAIQALRENKMCPMTAMDWLLAKGCRQEKDACSETSAEDISAGATAQASADKHMNAEVSNCSTEAEQKGIVGAMLECFQEYKRKDFKPNKKAMSNLKEMGFSETAILDALRIHSNSQEAACEWLLGDRRPKPVDLQVGLDTSSAIYRSIVSNPVVQLGLCSPKTLLALLQMLENPGCASRWLNDSDTAPILSQIFRIYHAEKHSVQLVRPLVM